MEADSYAAVTMFAKLFGPHSAASLSFPFLEKSTDRVGTLLAVTLTAIIGVLKMFGNPLPDYDRWDQFDHPPEEVRRMGILGSVERHLRQWGQDELVDREETITTMVDSVDVALHQILAYPPLTDEWRRQFEPGGNLTLICYDFTTSGRRFRATSKNMASFDPYQHLQNSYSICSSKLPRQMPRASYGLRLMVV